MWRERARAALRAAASSTRALAGLFAAALLAARLLAARVRSIDLSSARAGAARAWHVARHRPDAVLGAALLVGVLVMVAHWAGKASAEPPPRPEPPAAHAMAGP